MCFVLCFRLCWELSWLVSLHLMVFYEKRLFLELRCLSICFCTLTKFVAGFGAALCNMLKMNVMRSLPQSLLSYRNTAVFKSSFFKFLPTNVCVHGTHSLLVFSYQNYFKLLKGAYTYIHTYIHTCASAHQL